MTATLALSKAASQIGYYAPDDPEPGSKYGRWAAGQLNQAWLKGPSTSIWWCMLFASWAVYQAGGKIPGGISFNTDYTIRHARSEGRLVARASAKPGDLIIYNWDGDSATDHVGILEKVISGGIQTIEGNTSGSNAGSQSAGNGVWRRTRSWAAVAAIVRPYYTTSSKPAPSKPVVSKPAAKPSKTKLSVDGYLGALTVGRLQQVLGTTADGVISGQDRGNAEYLPALSGVEYTASAPGSQMVIALQKRLGVTADGHLGPKTIKAWQRKLGVKADGYLGVATGKAIQKALNTGKAY